MTTSSRSVSRPLARGLALSASLVAMLVSASAFAQAADPPPVPEGTLKDAKATSGSTDITSTKATTMAKNEPDAKDATELSVQAGALLATGNARTLSVTAGSKFRWRRAENQLSAGLAANYGQSGAAGSQVVANVENIQGNTRYDRFLGDFTLFLGVQARRDRFQGLDLRLQVDPGVGYYFIQEKNQQLWLEAGYDLLHDIRRNEDRQAKDPTGDPVIDTLTGERVYVTDKTQTVHSGRLFAGYELALETGFKLSAGLEFLQGLSDTDIQRLNGTLQASAKVTEKLSMSLAFTERFDSKPVQGKKQFDTITTASLIYSFY